MNPSKLYEDAKKSLGKYQDSHIVEAMGCCLSDKKKCVQLVLLIFLFIILLPISLPIFIVAVLVWAQWLVDLAHYFVPSIIFNFDPELSVCPDTGKKLAALTIDDGPLENAGEILDILKEYDVKATWFVISDHMERYPEFVKRIVDEGHEMQNHGTQDHKAASIKKQLFEPMLMECAGTISKYDPAHAQKYRKCYRPGGGLWNASMLDTCSRCDDHKLILGNVFGHDAFPCPGKWFYRWTLKHRSRKVSFEKSSKNFQFQGVHYRQTRFESF